MFCECARTDTTHSMKFLFSTSRLDRNKAVLLKYRLVWLDIILQADLRFLFGLFHFIPGYDVAAERASIMRLMYYGKLYGYPKLTL